MVHPALASRQDQRRTALPKSVGRLGATLAASSSYSRRPGSRPLPGPPSRCGREGDGAERAPSPPPTWGRLSAEPGRCHRASLLCPAGGAAPGQGRGTGLGMGEGRHAVRWPPEFPGAGPRERGASGCVHAPLTELLAAGQPLITRGPSSPLAAASHTFAADWPTPGPALYPARGAGQAERLPAWGGGQTARSAVASTSQCSRLWLGSQQPAARDLRPRSQPCLTSALLFSKLR